MNYEDAINRAMIESGDPETAEKILTKIESDIINFLIEEPRPPAINWLIPDCPQLLQNWLKLKLANWRIIYNYSNNIFSLTLIGRAHDEY